MKTLSHPLWTPPNLNSWEDPLIQEIYWPDRWRMSIVCLCLNMTSGKQVRPVLHELFSRWPIPEAMSHAHEDTLKSVIKTLGFVNKRSKTLKKMSRQWVNKDWTIVKELHGCGQYAQDSDSIFFLGDLDINPKDGELARYIQFARKHS